MPIRFPSVEMGCYLTDGRRLLRVLSLSDREALCEDAATLAAEGLSLKELGRAWRRVWPTTEKEVP